MYHRILVALENSPTDAVSLRHIEELAAAHHSEVLLVHVADGFAARNFDKLQLAESAEMKADREYLEGVSERLRERGLAVEAKLLLGDPATQIARQAEESGADLIAMSTHGHRFLADLLFGSTADKLRHSVDIPVLLIRAPRRAAS